MFDDLAVSRKMKKSNKPWAVVVSSVVQTLLLGILIMIPLISYSELPKGFNATYLAVPPPPPPAPAPPPVRELEQHRRLISIRENLRAPAVVPRHIEIINEPEPTVDFSNPNGIPGSIGDSGLLTDVLGSRSTPPPPPKPPARIRVGGVIEAARLTRQTVPVYPKMAIIARAQGTVVLHAVIGKDGAITSLQYISGPALLVKAAEDAVATWRYQPLVLNSEPTEVETEISVVFTLSE